MPKNLKELSIVSLMNELQENGKRQGMATNWQVIENLKEEGELMKAELLERLTCLVVK